MNPKHLSSQMWVFNACFTTHSVMLLFLKRKYLLVVQPVKKTALLEFWQQDKNKATTLTWSFIAFENKPVERMFTVWVRSKQPVTNSQ